MNAERRNGAREPIRLSDHFSYGRLVRFVMPTIIMMIFTSIYSVVDVPPLLSCRHPSRAGSHPPLRDALIFLLFGELQLARTYRTNSQMGTAFFAKGLPHYPQKARFSLSWHQCLYCTGKAAAMYPPAAAAGQFPPT